MQHVQVVLVFWGSGLERCCDALADDVTNAVINRSDRAVYVGLAQYHGSAAEPGGYPTVNPPERSRASTTDFRADNADGPVGDEQLPVPTFNNKFFIS